MEAMVIRQSVIIKGAPHELYEAILDPKIHSKFTNSKATNTRAVDGKFTAYDGYISGINIALEKDKKIVQKWTSSDFPEGHYTEVTFEFMPDKEGTKIVFTQTNVPKENYKEIAQGWKDFYWKLLKEMFG